MSFAHGRIESFFTPSSVAVVGASPLETKVGHVIFHNLVINKQRQILKTELFPVNPKYQTILGVRCYPSLLKLPQEVETVVVCTPAAAVPQIIKEAAARQCKSMIIISAGFSEVGNKQLEDEVNRIGREEDIRIIGPNCLGVYDPYSGMDTLFLPEVKLLSSGREVIATPRPLRGEVALITQSGAFGAAALDYMAGHGIGVSKFVSYGNKVDVAEPELLRYFMEDEKTRVILLYTESIGDGREFLETARNVSMKKPIVALKVGRTRAGARAAASHTASLSGEDKIYEAAFEQCGVLRAETMEEFFDMARAVLTQPPAAGRRVAILTDGGGPGIMAADKCEESNLRVERFSLETMAKFEALKKEGKLPPIMTDVNPVDLTGSATSEMYERTLNVLLEDDEIDSIIAIVLHHVPAILDDVIEKIARTMSSQRKPITVCDIGGTEMAEEFRTRFEKYCLPSYSTPERAARAIYCLTKYGEYLKRNNAFEDYLKIFTCAPKIRLNLKAGANA
jgi:acyl-CoA synthetase (NDP forming)